MKFNIIRNSGGDFILFSRRFIQVVLSALALFASPYAQAALLEFTDATAFQTALAGLGFAVETQSEGFEPTVNGVDTPWAAVISPDLLPEVSNLGVRWFQTNPVNPGFSIVQNGGDTQEEQYAMNLPGLLTTSGTTMSYAMETSGFKLVAFGGWFKDNNAGAKPVFTLDTGSVIAAGPLGLDWEFRGFIDDDPNGGFTQVFVTETETVDELEFFYTDAVTLVAQPGLFPSDSDGDGVLDIDDNCPLTANPNQSDSDGDGIGDVCDPDDDNDGVLDGADLCPNTPIGETVDANGCPINSAPVAVDDAANTAEDTAVTIDVLVNDSDVDGDTLSVTSVGTAANGSVVNNGTNVTYTPNANFTGTDSFTYTVTDGLANATATVTVTVGAANDAPVAADDAANTAEDTAVIIDVLANDSDVDGDALSVTSVGTAANGSVVNNGTNVTYTPNANFTGTDNFTYTVTDGLANATATVTVTVGAANDAPVAADDAANTAEDTAVTIDVLVNDSDVDGDTLSVTSVGTAANGSVVNNGTNVTYTPNANFTGTDSFTYTVTDGLANATATVTVTVGAANDAPVAADDAANTAEDTAVIIDVLANDSDVDGDTLSVTSVGTAANGSVVNNGTNVTYTPNANFTGSDSFTYTVSDGLLTDTAMVTVTVSQLDSDGDGVSDATDNCPTTPNTDQLDTDGDGIGDLCDGDHHPVISFEFEFVEIPSTGLLTSVVLADLGVVTASDVEDGSLIPVTDDAPNYFVPGRHEINWSVSDSDGNSVTAIQTLDVLPMASLGPDQLAGIVNGIATATIDIYLNGSAAVYPVSIDCNVVDYDAADDEVSSTQINNCFHLNSGQLYSFVYVLHSDAAYSMVTLSTMNNATPGLKTEQLITVVSEQVPPLVDLSLEQGGDPVTTVAAGAGLVTVSALGSDLNGDSLSYDWTGTDAVLGPPASGASFSFDPATLGLDGYRIRVAVSDGTDATTVERGLLVVDGAVVLSDSDEDGIPDSADAISTPEVLQGSDTMDDSYLLNTEPGLTLELGSVALLNESYSADIMGLLDFSDAHTNVGGIYDFTVTSLPQAGQTVRVVIPLLEAIPGNALYLKYFEATGWTEFVIDANNGLASAPGVPGICPLVGDASYVSGLNEGHFCLQVTMQDGGPNDADGQFNAQVADPSGIGTLNDTSVPVTSSGGGGGGAIGLFGLFALLVRLFMSIFKRDGSCDTAFAR